MGSSNCPWMNGPRGEDHPWRICVRPSIENSANCAGGANCASDTTFRFDAGDRLRKAEAEGGVGIYTAYFGGVVEEAFSMKCTGISSVDQDQMKMYFRVAKEVTLLTAEDEWRSPPRLPVARKTH